MQSRHAADQAEDRTEPTTRAPSPWNDASERKLRDLWAEGVSLNGIALAIGGINRNQVVGKVHRLKLPSRPSPLSPDARSWYRTANGKAVNVQGFEAYKAARNSAVPQQDASVERAEADRLRIEAERAEADRLRVEALFPRAPLHGANLAVQSLKKEQCRWPFGDPRNADFCFCSGQARIGDVYCEDHAKVAYVPALPRKARAA